MFYLLVGDKSRELEYTKIINRIKNENPGISEKYFDAAQKEEEGFLQTISTNSMFSSKELVVLKRAEKISKFWNFLKILKNFNIANKIILIDFFSEKGSFSKKSSSEAKGLCKLVEVYQEKDRSYLLGYLQEELKIDKRTALSLLEMIGTDGSVVKNEVDKLKLFFNDSSFNLEKAKKLVSLTKEYSIFELIQGLLDGKKEPLIRHLKKESDHMLFLALFASELGMLLKLKLLVEAHEITQLSNYTAFKNKEFDKIKEYFYSGKGYPHPYVLFLKFKSLNKFSTSFLKKNLEKLLELESKIKMGLAVEDTLVEAYIVSF